MEKQSKVSLLPSTTQTVCLHISGAQWWIAGKINRANFVSATTSFISKPYSTSFLQSRHFHFIITAGITLTYKTSEISVGKYSISPAPFSITTLSHNAKFSLHRSSTRDAEACGETKAIED